MLKLSSRGLSLENNFFFLNLNSILFLLEASLFSPVHTEHYHCTGVFKIENGYFFFNPSHYTFPRTGLKKAGCGSVRVSRSFSSYLFPRRTVSRGCRMPWSWFQGNAHIAGDKHLFGMLPAVYRSRRTVLEHKYKQDIHDPVLESVETSVGIGDRHAN